MFARVKLVLYDYRKKASGKYPVKLRITYNRMHKDILLGIDLSSEEFSGATKKNPPKHLRNIATQLQNFETKAKSIIAELSVFTFHKFEEAFFGQTKDASDIFPFFEEYIQNLKSEGRIKTAIAYQTAANTIRNFIGKKHLHLLDVTPAFLKKFQDQLMKDGKSISTIGIYVRTLRVIYNYCIAKGVIKKDENYPFGRGRFVIPAGKNVKKALSLEEIKRIYEFPTEPNSFQDRAKDMWLFSYYCNGMNFKDIALLKYKNVDGDMIRFVREKTKRTGQADQKIISCYVTDKARAIIQKWGTKNEEDKEAYVFPILSKDDSPESLEKKIAQFIQNTNKNMDRICKAVGIEKKVTTYFSRHSAATVLKKSGASIIQIQEALGHSSPMITQKYLDSFDDEVKRNLANTLSSF